MAQFHHPFRPPIRIEPMNASTLAYAVMGVLIGCGDTRETHPTPAVSEPQVKEASTDKCNVSAWGSGPVRQKPNANAAVLSTLPEMQLTVVDIQSGYFLYRSATPVIEEVLTPEEREQINKAPKRAWIETVGLGTSASLGHFRLYAKPELSAARIIDATDAQVIPFSDGAAVSTVLDCKGSWVKVTMSNGQVPSEEVTGWLSAEHQCDNPLTSCP